MAGPAAEVPVLVGGVGGVGGVGQPGNCLGLPGGRHSVCPAAACAAAVDVALVDVEAGVWAAARAALEPAEGPDRPAGAAANAVDPSPAVRRRLSRMDAPKRLDLCDPILSTPFLDQPACLSKGARLPLFATPAGPKRSPAPGYTTAPSRRARRDDRSVTGGPGHPRTDCLPAQLSAIRRSGGRRRLRSARRHEVAGHHEDDIRGVALGAHVRDAQGA